MEEAGIVTRKRGRGGLQEYHLTDSGRELEPIVMAVGAWGQRWIEKDLSLQHLDAQLLMWDMRRNLNADPLPARRSVIHFQYADAPAMQRKWWLVVEANGEVDLCSVDPGFDVDLYAACDLRTMTAIWMGYDTVKRALAQNALLLTGDAKIAKNMQTWLGLSPLAKVERVAS